MLVVTFIRIPQGISGMDARLVCWRKRWKDIKTFLYEDPKPLIVQLRIRIIDGLRYVMLVVTLIGIPQGIPGLMIGWLIGKKAFYW